MAETVRIEPAAHAALVEIARAKQVSLVEALSRAVEAYRRDLFLDGVANDFMAMQDDARAWTEEQAERAAWDTTNRDRLDDE